MLGQSIIEWYADFAYIFDRLDMINANRYFVHWGTGNEQGWYCNDHLLTGDLETNDIYDAVGLALRWISSQ